MKAKNFSQVPSLKIFNQGPLSFRNALDFAASNLKVREIGTSYSVWSLYTLWEAESIHHDRRNGFDQLERLRWKNTYGA